MWFLVWVFPDKSLLGLQQTSQIVHLSRDWKGKRLADHLFFSINFISMIMVQHLDFMFALNVLMAVSE